ncbi:MAG: hypothetical protein ABI193_13725 [Minicystis sp.]
MKLSTLFNALGACVALAIPISAVVGSSGCGQTVCVQWAASKGACPSQLDARLLFGTCSEIQTVDGEAVAGDNLCCYPVTKVSDGFGCLEVGSAGEGPVPPPDFASSSTGPIPACDFTGSCGESFSGCAGCAANGPCVDIFNTCLQTPSCDALRSCIDACVPGDPDCKGTCLSEHPAGQQLYGNFATCVFCKNCPNDCNANTDLCSFEMGTGGMSGVGGTMTGAGGAGGTMTSAGGKGGAGGTGGTMTGTGGAGGTMTGAGGAGGKGG